MVRVRAPELSQGDWLNTDRPLFLKDLRGRIVLLDFWTYCCINCLHILPALKSLEQKYKDSLTVIGIHSAKFDHEKEVDNVRQAILRYDIEHPVLMDSDFQTWQQYAVRAYPTLVVIDPQGYVVRSVSGEGNQASLNELIGKMVQEHRTKGTIAFQEFNLTLEKQNYSAITPLAFPGKVLADEASDRLFIADSGHHRIVIATLNGEVLQIAGTGKLGFTDGAFAQAQFAAPQGMAFDHINQVLYVADTGNHALRQLNLNQETVNTIAGTGEQSHTIYPHSGRGLETPLNSPWDLELVTNHPSEELQNNQLFIAMAGPHQIWQMQLAAGTLTTYAGTGAEGCADGLAAESAFAQPSGITTNGKELFIADSETSSIRAISLEAVPKVRTVCGSGDLFGFGDMDGIGEAARLQHCLGVEYKDSGLWVADTYNHKIKHVDTESGSCQTVLGNQQAETQNYKSHVAQLSEPSGVSATKTHLYIADTNNHAIRRVALDTLCVTTIDFPGLCAPGVCLPEV